MANERTVGLSSLSEEKDPNAPSRKKDHIELAFQSQISQEDLDKRLYYEPILSAHPREDAEYGEIPFLGKKLAMPVWVSSMTGGTQKARIINRNLAIACNEFGMGMGLGSCRALLYSDEYFEDFNVRPYLGPDQPLFANLGIAQVEELVQGNATYKMNVLIEKLQADGLIIHVNPLQEWLQPEGDKITVAPLETIKAVLDSVDFPVIVKEVGQGMGYESLKALLKLPLAAVEFAAAGGTNFARLELLRHNPEALEAFGRMALIGHTAEEMTDMCNRIVEELGDNLKCQQLIISGGIQHFLDGYYLISKSKLNAVYGQASAFLKHAQGDYEDLRKHVAFQLRGLKMAKAFLKVKL